MSNSRDRATGWKHAKLSGHTNESLVKQKLDKDSKYKNKLLERINKSDAEIESISIGGLHETNVPGILGKKTKSKTDLKIHYKNGTSTNVSIKKSLGGQVYFIRVGLFFQVFEKQFKKSIPENIKRAMELFWAAADDADAIIEKFADKSDTNNFNLQKRHHSLNATTLKRYNENLYTEMLQWFRDNAYELTKLSFAMGAAKDKSEWSDYVWYINLLGENNTDEIFETEKIACAAKQASKEETDYSIKNGGTTIQLPFGFVQWHQGQMQFHHNFEKVQKLAKG